MKTKIQKEQMVASITEKLARAKSVVFADYQGLTMPHLQALRAILKDQTAEFSVTKNTLLEIALKNSQYSPLPDDIMEGPIATLFAFADEITPIKALVKTLKDAQIGKVKGGFLNKELLLASEIMQLSTLPSKIELQGKVVGVLAAPLLGMVNVLQGNLRNLVYALNEIKIKKEVSK